MISYSLTATPYQSFIVDGLTISLLWVDDMGWSCGIEGIVEGVRLSPNLPIFRQYGYDNLIFMSSKGEINFDDISTTYLTVL